MNMTLKGTTYLQTCITRCDKYTMFGEILLFFQGQKKLYIGYSCTEAENWKDFNFRFIKFIRHAKYHMPSDIHQFVP